MKAPAAATQEPSRTFAALVGSLTSASLVVEEVPGVSVGVMVAAVVVVMLALLVVMNVDSTSSELLAVGTVVSVAGPSVGSVSSTGAGSDAVEDSLASTVMSEKATVGSSRASDRVKQDR